MSGFLDVPGRGKFKSVWIGVFLTNQVAAITMRTAYIHHSDV